MNVDLRINELVLRGLGHLNGEAVGEVVKSELRRLIAEQGIPTGLERSSTLAGLDAGKLSVASTDTAATVGARVARAVYGGLGR